MAEIFFRTAEMLKPQIQKISYKPQVSVKKRRKAFRLVVLLKRYPQGKRETVISWITLKLAYFHQNMLRVKTSAY